MVDPFMARMRWWGCLGQVFRLSGRQWKACSSIHQISPRTTEYSMILQSSDIKSYVAQPVCLCFCEWEYYWFWWLFTESNLFKEWNDTAFEIWMFQFDCYMWKQCRFTYLWMKENILYLASKMLISSQMTMIRKIPQIRWFANTCSLYLCPFSSHVEASLFTVIQSFLSYTTDVSICTTETISSTLCTMLHCCTIIPLYGLLRRLGRGTVKDKLGGNMKEQERCQDCFLFSLTKVEKGLSGTVM